MTLTLIITGTAKFEAEVNLITKKSDVSLAAQLLCLEELFSWYWHEEFRSLVLEWKETPPAKPRAKRTTAKRPKRRPNS